jgi:aminoglycoside phosphotransferase (APT) family kinase protein
VSDFVDQSTDIRDGEQLDLAKLEPYLKKAIPGLDGPLVVKQYPSGFSNLTYAVRVGDREMVLRRPPFGSKVKSAHDMGREYRVLSKLHPHYPPAPEPLVYCEDTEILGAPFYVMKRIKGAILRMVQPPGMDINPDQTRRLCESFIDNLILMHGIDYQAVGLGDLGKPEGYVERQVNGWIKRYHGSQTDEIPDIDNIAKWIADRTPPDSGATLVHNDYKFDNIMLDPNDLTRVIGVLDWEMTTIGDPLIDLGTTLAYWVEPTDEQKMQIVRTFVTVLPGAMTRVQLAERYAKKTGRDISNMLWYYCFALFKLAGIVQQIYFRYAKGLTKDERFAPLIHSVRGLGKYAVQCAETGKF